MYYETKTLPNHFDRLVLRVRKLREGTDDLMDPKTTRGIAQTLNSSDVVYNIARRVDEWIATDELAKQVTMLEDYLARESLEGYLNYDMADQWWDDKGKSMLAAIFSQSMRTIVRGVDYSGNDVMRRMAEEMAVKAAKRILEYVCHVSEYDLYGEKVADFILNGLDAEREANEAERLFKRKTTVTALELRHNSKTWSADSYNADGEIIGYKDFHTNSVMEARVLIKAYRIELHVQHHPNITIKEFTKDHSFVKNL